MAHLYMDPAGDRYVIRKVGPYRPWRERFRPWNVLHRLVWLSQVGRVPTCSHDEAKAHLRRWRALSPQGAAGSPCRSWRNTFRGRTRG